jgi:hypothetical protein
MKRPNNDIYDILNLLKITFNNILIMIILFLYIGVLCI